MTITRVRDLVLLDGLVIACDSVGGIGDKPADTVWADARTVAHFAARVPLLEVLCAGADPIVVVDSLSVERHPTGEVMIAEITAMVSSLGDVVVTGSTEENVTVQATAIGVTVIGRRREGGVRPGGGRAGDRVLLLGLPRSAPQDQVRIGHPDVVGIDAVRAALGSPGAHDALPVGSRGVGHELGELARTAGLVARVMDSPVNMDTSGGPASCVLLSCAADAEDAVRALLPPGLPVHLVATLETA